MATEVDYATANRKCEEQGAYLVKIQSNSENEFIASTNPDTAVNRWIGINAHGRDGNWSWTHGPGDNSYKFWADGYDPEDPDNDDVVGACGYISLSDFRWSIATCTQQHHYVCEKGKSKNASTSL